MVKFDLEKYNYYLPKNLLAATPAKPRDSARLFVFNTKTNKIKFDVFRNLPKYLPKNSLLVLNNTKVIPARINLKKETGGKIEVLLLLNEYSRSDKFIKGLVDRRISVGQKLFFDKTNYLTVIKQNKKIFFFLLNFPYQKLNYLLNQFGQTPIPKYLKNTPLKEQVLRQRYQSMFAKNPASIAAPTASLHFTPRLLKKIKKIGIKSAYITLHVGLGTFAPINKSNFQAKKLHEEFYQIARNDLKKIKEAKKSGKKLLPWAQPLSALLNPRQVKNPAMAKLNFSSFRLSVLNIPTGWLPIFIYRNRP